jgi:hypothetical protein
VQPGQGDRAFVVAEDEVLEVTEPVDLGPTAYPTALHEMSETDRR